MAYSTFGLESSSCWVAPCRWPDCNKRAYSISWPKVAKGVPNQGVDCLLANAVSLFLFCVSGVCSVVFVFGC